MENKQDFYLFQQGKRFAVEMLETLRDLASDPKFALPVIDKLELACANKPPRFAEGVHVITRAVRHYFGGMKMQL